jgi:DNA-binding response OmpR family regulator
MILDIMLPHLDGFSVCKAANMRGLVSTLAVLVRAPQKT